MPDSDVLDFDLDTVPVDVFDLEDSGLEVETLTTGHGQQSACLSLSCTSYTD
jgi:hypothetical protein